MKVTLEVEYDLVGDVPISRETIYEIILDSVPKVIEYPEVEAGEMGVAYEHRASTLRNFES